MSDAEIDGNLVRVATCPTPTEAYTVKGVLESAGLRAFVVDAQLAQAHSWMASALGGVRVMVPAAQAQAAAEALQDFHGGMLALEDTNDTALPPSMQRLDRPIFSPDKAALWGFALTPAVGAGVQLLNAYVLDAAPRRRRDVFCAALLLAATVAAVTAVHTLSPGPALLFRTSLILAPLTALWYLAVGQDQSRYVIQQFGVRFPRRNTLGLALTVAGGELLVGWLLSEFA